MIKIEEITLEAAYKRAASTLECSVTELVIEVIQAPSSGFLGLFKKKAIIVAAIKQQEAVADSVEAKEAIETPQKDRQKQDVQKQDAEEISTHTILNDTIMPASFVSDQDEQEDDLGSGIEYTADYDDAFDEDEIHDSTIYDIVQEVEDDINRLFASICFKIEKIEVKVHDAETLLIEFKGDDAALLIGKEGYRYKALSYMIFNWINSKYDVQLRLEIAEFLKNQEESVGRYLTNVYENIERDGRAQTKILDGVLVQIALKELRERYPDKYVVIRSTRDGLKYIIVNDYHSN